MRLPRVLAGRSPARAATATLLGAGLGLAQAPPQFGLVAPPAFAALQLTRTWTVDVDGDGDLDVLGTARSLVHDALYLLRNDGNGVLTDVTTAQVPGLLQQRILGVTPFDCDGDGDVDLWLGGSHTGVSLLRNDGSGTFTVAATLTNLPSVTAAAGDLDGDGDLDLALAPDVLLGGQYRLLINDGSGGFSPGPSFGNSVLATVALFDLDQDGDLDVYYPSSRQLLRNDGGLSFTDVAATQLLVPPPVGYGAMVRGDLDGDGDGDFVFTGGVAAPDVAVLHQGNTLVVGSTMPVQPQTRAWALGDFDRDGDLDLLRAHPGGAMTLARNDGLGTFIDAVGHLPPFPIWSQDLHAADLDGDGDPDVLTCFLGSATLLLQNRHVHLEVGAATRGQPWSVELWSEPGYAVADGLGVLAVSLVRLPAPSPVPPFGDLWLDLTGALLVADTIPASAGRRVLTFGIPGAAQLVGVELNVQGLVASGTGAVRLTALCIATIQ